MSLLLSIISQVHRAATAPKPPEKKPRHMSYTVAAQNRQTEIIKALRVIQPASAMQVAEFIEQSYSKTKHSIYMLQDAGKITATRKLDKGVYKDFWSIA